MRQLGYITSFGADLSSCVADVTDGFNSLVQNDRTVDFEDIQIVNTPDFYSVVVIYSFNNPDLDPPTERLARVPQFIGMPVDADPRQPTLAS